MEKSKIPFCTISEGNFNLDEFIKMIYGRDTLCLWETLKRKNKHNVRVLIVSFSSTLTIIKAFSFSGNKTSLYTQLKPRVVDIYQITIKAWTIYDNIALIEKFYTKRRHFNQINDI
ncbi:hypothetical protein HZS_6008 [Henneguya salminicola]|nr:hypothetical protein HZS_6008 [Henneguya salminicola]